MPQPQADASDEQIAQWIQNEACWDYQTLGTANDRFHAMTMLAKPPGNRKTLMDLGVNLYIKRGTNGKFSGYGDLCQVLEFLRERPGLFPDQIQWLDEKLSRILPLRGPFPTVTRYLLNYSGANKTIAHIAMCTVDQIALDLEQRRPGALSGADEVFGPAYEHKLQSIPTIDFGLQLVANGLRPVCEGLNSSPYARWYEGQLCTHTVTLLVGDQSVGSVSYIEGSGQSLINWPGQPPRSHRATVTTDQVYAWVPF
ncbi:hypothetical protein QBC35DRAFT_455101 [Podospora australis]|uniref:Uncharacterized protein n=1 Tax=Podospora australis TaxID=1536484 RepID=A0AAN6WNN1_9PEZI|nr:hypothetical protein QBC35DRAFT_455101 [Podospora australis]